MVSWHYGVVLYKIVLVELWVRYSEAVTHLSTPLGYVENIARGLS